MQNAAAIATGCYEKSMAIDCRGLSNFVRFVPRARAPKVIFPNGVRKGRSIRTSIPKVIRPEIFSAKFAFRALRRKTAPTTISLKSYPFRVSLPPARNILLKPFALYQSIALEELYNFVFECVTIGERFRQQISDNRGR